MPEPLWPVKSPPEVTRRARGCRVICAPCFDGFEGLERRGRVFGPGQCRCRQGRWDWALVLGLLSGSGCGPRTPVESEDPEGSAGATAEAEAGEEREPAGQGPER